MEDKRKRVGVERRNAQTLGVAVLVCVGVGWGVWRVCMGLW